MDLPVPLLSNLEAHEAEVSFAHRRKQRAAERLAAARAEDAAADAQLARVLDGLAAWIAANPADQMEMFNASA